MVKILLCCAAGMSTSMVVKKMQEAATSKSIEAEIKAVGLDEFENCLPSFDIVLLGPQVKYKEADFSASAAKQNKKVKVINSMDYGMMKGDKILDDAIAELA